VGDFVKKNLQSRLFPSCKWNEKKTKTIGN